MSRQKRRPSLFRRLIYFVIVLISGGGAGGYVLQDHPVVKSLLSLVTGESADAAVPKLDGSLVTEVVDALKPTDLFTQPGLYQVTIAKIELDQKLFRPGHTLDIQARVRKLNSDGRDTTLWDSKAFGSRLAVVGRDDLTVGWPNRPLEVRWNTGEQFVLEVYDARTNLFIQPRRFTMAKRETSAKRVSAQIGRFSPRVGTELRFAGQSSHQPRRASDRTSGRRPLGNRAPDPGNQRRSRHHPLNRLEPQEEEACPRDYPSTVSKAKPSRSPFS